MHKPTCHQRFRVGRGFTLIELMVTLGILVVIIGIALPIILNARKTGFVIRQKSDLALIDTALQAYKADFGDIPRFPDQITISSETGNQQWLDWSGPRGAVLLCMALVSPGPAVANTETTATSPVSPGDDGADGLGFRVRRNFIVNGTVLTATGKVYGPYVDPSKFKISYLTGNSTVFSTYPQAYPVMDDIYGNPILYYPAKLGPLTITTANGATGYFVTELQPSDTTAPPKVPLYNAVDNENDGGMTGNSNMLVSSMPAATSSLGRYFLSAAQMQYILGDRDADGQISPATEHAAATLPYLLWCAGADGQYGFGLDGSKSPATPKVAPFTGMLTDDVTNFDIPADLQKK